MKTTAMLLQQFTGLRETTGPKRTKVAPANWTATSERLQQTHTIKVHDLENPTASRETREASIKTRQQT